MSNVDTLRQILSNDLAAKWVNLRDYALDKLEANSAIKAIMDDVNKYGYGEWVKNVTAQVPAMTSATAPSGQVNQSSQLTGSGTGITYYGFWAFNQNTSETSAWASTAADRNTCWIQYTFPSAKVIKEFKIRNSAYWGDGASVKKFKLQGSNDGFSTHDELGEYTSKNLAAGAESIYEVENPGSYTTYRIQVTENNGDPSFTIIHTIQFYTAVWQPLGNVPIMTANNAPYGTVFRSSALRNEYEAWKAFTQVYGNSWLPTQNQSHDYIGYIFVNPLCIKRVHIKWQPTQNTNLNFVLQGSNDTTNGSDGTWTDIKTIPYDQAVSEIDIDIDNASSYFKAYRLYSSSSIYTSSYGINIFEVQFYGRELKPLVPTMTANNKPKGTVTYSSQYDTSNYPAWKAFNESQSNGWSVSGSDTFANNYIAYEFDEPQLLDKCAFWWTSGSSYRASATAKIYGSENGTDFTEIGTVTAIQNTGKNIIDIIKGYYKAIKCNIASKAAIDSSASTVLQSGNGYKFQFYGMDYSEKEFATGSTRKTIYDHGVELEEIEYQVFGSASATKEPNQLYGKKNSGGTTSGFNFVTKSSIDLTDFNYAYTRLGNKASATASSCANVTIEPSKPTAYSSWPIDSYSQIYLPSIVGSVDISSFNEAKYVAVQYGETNNSGEHSASIKELWLE